MMTQAHLQGYARTDAAAGLPLAAARRTARALDREWGRGTGAIYLAAFRAA